MDHKNITRIYAVCIIIALVALVAGSTQSEARRSSQAESIYTQAEFAYGHTDISRFQH